MKTMAVSKISGATERQLQWWDEKGYIRPVIVGHERSYTIEQCTLANAMADMRARHIPLGRAVQIVKALAKRPDAGWLACGAGRGQKIYFAQELAGLAGILARIEGPLYIQQVRRCISEPEPLPQLQRGRVRRMTPRPAWLSNAPSRRRMSDTPDPVESRMAARAADVRDRLAGTTIGERW